MLLYLFGVSMKDRDFIIVAAAVGAYFYRDKLADWIKGLVPKFELPAVSVPGTFEPGTNIGFPYNPPANVPAPYRQGGSGTRLDASAPVVPMTAAQYRHAITAAAVEGAGNLNPNLGPLAAWPGIPSLGIAGFNGLGKQAAAATLTAEQQGLILGPVADPAVTGAAYSPVTSLFKTGAAQARRAEYAARQPIRNPVAGSSDRYTSTEQRQYGNTVSFVSIPQQLPASAYAASGGRPLWLQQ